MTEIVGRNGRKRERGKKDDKVTQRPDTER